MPTQNIKRSRIINCLYKIFNLPLHLQGTLKKARNRKIITSANIFGKRGCMTSILMAHEKKNVNHEQGFRFKEIKY